MGEEHERSDARRLAFIAYKELEEGMAYRGAALITDDRCRPLEFRCTSAIRPNTVQRTLYGQQLLPHITNELMTIPLLRAVRERPAVVLVNNEIFLNARLSTEIPLIFMRRQGEAIQVGRGESQESRQDILPAVEGRFQPIIITAHREYPDDLTQWRNTLLEIFSYVDLLEPFDRIAVAIEQVHEHQRTQRD